VASFRVVARGLGCIPILEVRERMSSGQAAARLAVDQDVNEERAEYDTVYRFRWAFCQDICQVRYIEWHKELQSRIE
jgi:hypothetical protein